MTNRWRVLPWLIGILVLLAALGLEWRPVPELQLADVDGSTLAILELPEGGFDHVFVHSVHRTPVVERFRIEHPEGRPVMHLYELRYQSQGVGMPSDAEGGFRLEGDTFVLAMDRAFEEIPIMVSPVEGHGLLVGQTFIPFTRFEPPGHRIVLSARSSRHIRLRRSIHHE